MSMQLIEGVAPEVYKAYFPHSISGSRSGSLALSDWGSENNLATKKGCIHYEKSPFFPVDRICAEDPDWDRIGNAPPSLAVRCIQTIAKYFSNKPESGCGLRGSERVKFLSKYSNILFYTHRLIIIL